MIKLLSEYHGLNLDGHWAQAKTPSLVVTRGDQLFGESRYPDAKTRRSWLIDCVFEFSVLPLTFIPMVEWGDDTHLLEFEFEELKK